ncbi:MAG: hypothetical protein ACKPKO_10560, partial [Candidatus Fonsibacter sp.]
MMSIELTSASYKCIRKLRRNFKVCIHCIRGILSCDARDAKKLLPLIWKQRVANRKTGPVTVILYEGALYW